MKLLLNNNKGSVNNEINLQDLEKIKASAIFGVRKGQEGIFYPPIDIE